MRNESRITAENLSHVRPWDGQHISKGAENYPVSLQGNWNFENLRTSGEISS